MTKREITSLVLKLIGIYIIASYIGYIPLTIITQIRVVYLQEPISLTNMLFAYAIVLSTLLYLVCCILFIIYSNRVSEWIIREDNTVRLPDSISKDDIITIAFCCVGLLIMARAIPKLFSTIPYFIMVRGTISGYSDGRVWQPITRVAGPLIEFMLGLLLFIRTKGLVRLWHKIRG
jgi:hypothetical protein